MDLLRSEAMQLVHLIIPNESAYWMISYLGLFQFNDLNASRSPFQRTYAAQIKLGELEAESFEINDNNEKLQRNYSEQLEDKLVLQRRHGMFLLIRSYYNSVGEFFHLAQSIAAAEQREQEVQQNGEGSIDSPL